MREKLKDALPVIVGFLILGILMVWRTGYEDAIQFQDKEHNDRCEAVVTKTNNDSIKITGFVKSGEQVCEVEFLGGKFKGQTAKATNFLQGSMENDKIYAVGDTAMVNISYQGTEVKSVIMVDHYRLRKEAILAIIFAIFLILFSGLNGLRAILSFALTILTIWKVLVPLYLDGKNPVIIGLLIVVLLTFFIIMLDYGFEIRTFVAMSGSLLGTLTTAILGYFFTDLFKINGAIMDRAENLLYSGYAYLDLTQIFVASIFIGASGAMMDLSVDITSALHEVIEKKPDIGWKEAFKSGMNVGRAAMGTMTTTLLLAYSGSYIALLMVFMAQGTPIYNILNYKYIASEILDTIVGSFGLVTVAPFTAFTGAIVMTAKKHKENKVMHNLSESRCKRIWPSVLNVHFWGLK